MDAVTLLWWLTGIYLAVLMLVLAVAVSSVTFYLWRTSVTLRKIADGLQAVQGHTAPLGGQIQAANDGLAAIARSLSSARDHLLATDSGLAVLTGGDAQQEVA